MIKTFPIVMTDEYHAEVAKAAKDQDMTLKDYILEAIEEKMKRDKQKNKK